ncbi:hypothetical protein BGX21_004766, partial [Mortierella sp. AD011]
CNLEIGFRVQFSDLAMLGYVQLQVVDSNNNVMVENIDNSTREDWNSSVHGKKITWSVPQDWPAGNYILRAFGNAYYSCKVNEKRTFCPLILEGRETIHVEHLAEDQSCPVATTSSTSSTSIMSPLSPSSQSSSYSTSLATNSKDSITTSSKVGTSANVGEDGSQKPSIHIDVDSSILLDLMRKDGVNLDQITNTTDGKMVGSGDSRQSKGLDQKERNIVDTGKQPVSSSGTRNANIGSGGMRTMMNNNVGLGCLVAAISFF